MVKKRGAVLLIVLIMVLAISLLGATLMALFFNVLTLSEIELDRARSLYLAEAGIAMAIAKLKTGQTAPAPKADDGTSQSESDERQDLIIPPTRLGTGSYEVYNNYSDATIISVGISNDVKRTIQVRYSAF